MNKIILFGAGRSATDLIDYLSNMAEKHFWDVTIVDADLSLIQKKLDGHSRCTGIQLDIHNDIQRTKLISDNDLVISLLPARFHHIVAADCLRLSKHLLTASYVDTQMKEMSAQAHKKGLAFMGELGLDPGLDHMSALHLLGKLKEQGADITAFLSYTGGLIAPEHDNNPWHYKFTWNPRNVVLAGQGVAQYRRNHRLRFVPYQRLFHQSKKIDIPGMGAYEVYANRDSLNYLDLYDLHDIPTILRGTIRHTGFCDAWKTLVDIGLTDDDCRFEQNEIPTITDLVEALIPAMITGETKERTAKFLNLDLDGEIMNQLSWIGLFDHIPLKGDHMTAAEALQQILMPKWKLEKHDKDMIIMQHEVEYKLDGQEKSVKSVLIMKGEDDMHTAMSKLVGLPLGIYAAKLMTGELNPVPTAIPNDPSVYGPVLKELEKFDVRFDEYVS